ncbi:MAG: histidine kinase dimerization/phosphoacceptor domain -containing protein [Desulfobacterales bacterium]
MILLKFFFQKGTIKFRLMVAFILLVLIPTSTIIFITTIIDLSNVNEMFKKKLFSLTSIKVAQIDSWVDMLQRDLRIVLTNTNLSQIADQIADDHLSENSTYLLSHFRSHFNEIFLALQNFEELFVLSSSGHVIISTSQKSQGEYRGHHPYFSEGFPNPGIHFHTQTLSSDSKTVNSVVAVHPVHNSLKEVVGLLCGRTSLARLDKIMTDHLGMGSNVETYLVGDNLVMLTGTKASKYFSGNIITSTKGIEAAIDRHENGFGRYVDYLGNPVLGVYQWLPKLQAAFLSEINQSEINRSIYTMLASNFFVGGLALILAGVASVYFTRGIADPLADLADTAARIAGGKLNIKAKEDLKDEIGVLAKAFNSMTSQLNRRLEIHRLISDMSREFIGISSAEIDSAIFRALKNFGQYYDADRSYLFYTSGEPDTFIKTHEWRREGIEPQMNLLQAQPAETSFPWLISRMHSIKVLHIPQVEELPQEASAEKAQWLFKGIRSVIYIPLYFGETLKGLIGFDFMTKSRKVGREDRRILRMIGEIICNCLERQHTEIALKHSREQYSLAQRAAKIGSLTLDLVTGKLNCSETTWDLLGHQNDEDQTRYETFISMIHPEDRELFNKAVQKSIEKNQHFDTEYRMILPNGSIRWIMMAGAVIRNDINLPVRMIGMICDITDRKESAEKIKASLKEKELLLKEIHHRVKNNLQIISSLMYLQSKNVSDKVLSNIFKDCESRIRSMAMVHESLYQSESVAEIDLAQYVRHLTVYLFQSYGNKFGPIQLKTDIQNIFLNINTAIPCGLIISELVSNALKHAFPDGKQGEIVVSFTKDRTGSHCLTVRDNGTGLPENMDWRNTDTLGLRLINILAQQLNGSLTYYGQEGACFVLTFTEPEFSRF